MSIWNSVYHGGAGLDILEDILEDIPSRDNYTGGPDGGPVGFVDVATATWFHPLIRVIVEPHPVLLTADEARELARRLQEAISKVEAER